MLRSVSVIILTFLLFSTSAFCQEVVYLLTLPKAGTHCIEKYFQLLHYIHKDPHSKIRRSHVSESHLHLPEHTFENPDVKKILLIRDLRDLFISALHYVEKKRVFLKSPIKLKQKGRSHTFEYKLLDLIDYTREPTYWKWEYPKRTLPQQLKKMVTKAIFLTEVPNTLIVRYEDLSGNHGADAQLKIFREINSFIDVTLDAKDEAFLQENLYGNKLIGSPYFRIGKMGRWRSLMKPSLRERIKELYGQNLIDLGYESDFDW